MKMHKPQSPYKEIGTYSIPIDGKQYPILTLVKIDGTISWMPDNEQQHVNPQYKDDGSEFPVKIDEISEIDMANILNDVFLIRTKKDVPLEVILEKHSHLVNRMLTDFKNHYQSNLFSSPSQ